MKNMLYYVEANKMTDAEIITLIKNNPNIKFVSLAAVDLGNNQTDERIPIHELTNNFSGFMKSGVQTDGSSVNLNKIAVINNAKVDIIPDRQTKWFVDYNKDNIDEESGLPIGVIIIPSFLRHDEKFVDSRSILKKAELYFSSEIKRIVNESDYLKKDIGLEEDEGIDKVVLTSATELEFWVKTPGNNSDVEKLSTSQVLKEQYWKRTIGPVRTALERTLMKLDNYGLGAEMAHKEVGGVPASLTGSNKYDHIMEQVEIDWKYDEALQSADNELFAREFIRDTFVNLGLEVSFLAKPIEGVAGSGEHHHMGAGAITTKGRYVNIFSPVELREKYMSCTGFGALMGLMRNYEVVNPFVSSSNDAFNRLKPGFEAPVCTVVSLGHNESVPARNRTVLISLIRDIENPKATRLELRSPNPYSNSYLTIAASFQAMLEGVKYVAKAEKSYEELLAEISKRPDDKCDYLEYGRMYRSEEDVFEHFTEEERNEYFGNPPATVWENMSHFTKSANKLKCLIAGDVFTHKIIESYSATYTGRWHQEIFNRIIPNNRQIIRSCYKLHSEQEGNDLDHASWEAINRLRYELMKDTLVKKSLFTRLKDMLHAGDYDSAAELQLEMAEKMKELQHLYAEYKLNLFEI